jgi:pimeloyl-ACP methyl ester carboxylesterase
VLTLPEMAAHYAAEIRRLQPRGPYSLIGYSFGGLIAFEVAARLGEEDDQADLVLLDTAAPPGPGRRVFIGLWSYSTIQRIVRALVHAGVVGPRALTLCGITSRLYRATLPFGPGPLTEAEVRLALRLVDPGAPELESSTLDVLCAALISSLWAELPSADWQIARQLLPMYSDDPLSAVKAYKVFVKNAAIARQYRSRRIFHGRMTVVAAADNARVSPWQRYASRTITVIRVPGDGRQRRRTHLSFLDARNVALYIEPLARLLGGRGSTAST